MRTVSILIHFWSSIKNNWKKKSAAQRTSAFSTNKKGVRPYFLMPKQVLVLYKCSGSTCVLVSVVREENLVVDRSMTPYLVKSGDRLEQITLICRGEREG